MIKTLYPKFQTWSEKGSVFIISDTHFYDSDRKFMGYNISEQEQINILKKKCHKNDTLIHLGDVGNPELLKEIKAYKVLIMGNHDETATQFMPYFDEIYTGPLWVAEKLVLSEFKRLKVFFASSLYPSLHWACPKLKNRPTCFHPLSMSC